MDDDLAAALPQPPPPHPLRREAAIATALRRFDGADAATERRHAAPARPRAFGRPQLAAVATVALVALIGLPVWMVGDHRFGTGVPHEARVSVPAPAVRAPMASEDASTARTDTSDSAASAPLAPRITPQQTPLTKRATVQAVPPAPAPVAGPPQAFAPSAPPPPPVETFDAPPHPPPAPAPAPPPARVAAPGTNADIVVTGSLIAHRAPPDGIVVTAQRRLAKESGNADWSRCTIDDPRHTLAACKYMLDPAAPGRDGRAAAFVAEGLMQAWSDDLNRAIAAFDQAIALSPRLATAYLNRGLAYRRKGELDRALADFDRAVRLDRDAAPAYHYRSEMLRRRGDLRRADADERRAIERAAIVP